MTRPAESITIELDDAIWTPASPNIFWENHSTWTPQTVHKWFSEHEPKKSWFARLMGESTLTMLSTALPGVAMRYVVRGDLLFPKWAALGHAELAEMLAPHGCRFEVDEKTNYLVFDDVEPFTFHEPLGLLRCSRSHDGIHWYVDGESQFSRKPERYLQPPDGANGHL